MIFTTQKRSRFFTWNCWKKHECKQIYFLVYFLKLLIFWLDFCFIDYGEFVIFVHCNKSRKPEKVFFCSFYLIAVLQYLIRFLFLFYCYFYCPAMNYLFGLKWINKKVVVSFSVNLVRLQFEVWFYSCSQKGVIILPGSLPSHCAGLQLVTRPSHRKEEYYLTGLEPLLFRNSTHEEIDRSVTVSKASGFAFMVKSICLYM